MYFVYSLLYFIVTVILLPFEYLKRPVELRQRWLREKFGFLNSELRSASGGPNSKPVWVHAVSMGEVIAAMPFIAELKKRYPFMRIVLSTVTDTGRKVAGGRVSDIADVVYLPFDLSFVIRKIMKKIKPELFITIETEIWPNIFRVCKKAGIPVLVMNGRLSENSFKGYKKADFFIKGVLQCVSMFCMQEQIYAERIKALGVDESRIEVTGNFKFDTRPSDMMPEWAELVKGPLILAGSTHDGEEEIVLSVFNSLRDEFPDLALIIAPRHPERFRKVEELIKKMGFKYIKRSEISQQSTVNGHQITINQGTADSRPIIILDAVGELASVYGIADIAVIGGSFIRHGGQNPLEPAFWGKPIICGPHMENFPFIEDFYKRGGAIKADSGGLADVIAELMRSPEKRKAMGEISRAIYDEKSGSIEKSMAVLSHYINIK